MVARVLAILDENFHHPHLPIAKGALSGVSVSELSGLCRFLVDGILSSEKNPAKRPICPVTSQQHRSVARIPYKEAMLQYISGFGYRLAEYAGVYSPAFLEALANYLERKKKQKNYTARTPELACEK